MDPVTAVGLAAGLIQIITATAQAIQFLNDVKDAPKDRAKIVKEVANLLGLLTNLQYRMEEANPKDAWYGRLLSLGGEGGPLNQYKQAMENLAERLKPKSGVKDLQRRLKWTLNKKHIKETLDEIERLKALIGLALQEDNFELSLRIKQDISNVGQDVFGISQTVAKLNINQNLSLGRDLDEERQAVISWLSPLNFSTKQNDIFNRSQNGTGQWLLEAKEFRSWLSGDKRYLWCPGLPGGGKTILTSIVVNYLEQTFSPRDAAVIYIYNSYKEHDEQSTANLVGSLLQQIVRKKSVISDGIMTMYRQHLAQRTRPSLSELSSSLRLESKDFTHVFILVDALDECAEANGSRESLLKELHGHLVEPNTHLMITSRFIAGLEYDSNEVIFLEIRASNDDIEKYLHCRIQKERRLARHVESDENLHDAIITIIVNNAKGMFLLAQLHLDSLAKKHNKRDVRLALHSLPKELNSTYDKAMHRIYSQPTEDVALAKRVLSWISCARRPLTILEIRHALAVEPEAMDVDEEALIEEDLLVSVCVGLVMIEEKSSLIRLVHFTTQEYFERTRIDHLPTAEIDIAMSCLTYLSFEGYADLLFIRNEERELRDQYPLSEYIATHWATHIRGEPEDNPQVQRLALQLLENKHTVTVLHQAQQFAGGWLRWGSDDVLGLSMAAAFNLITITTLLLYRGARVEDASSPYHETALHYAADRGHGAIVKLLLERGAQIDAATENQETALMLAAASGHELVVLVLLECGADVNTRNDRDMTPLGQAVSSSSSTIVGMLLVAGADINAREGYDTALFEPVSQGNSDTVQLLLDAGIDIHRKNGRGETALFHGTDEDNGDTTRLLLDAGADVHAEACDATTSLFTAARRGAAAVVRLLLKEGADVNTRDNGGKTALFEAAVRGQAAIIEVLLKGGADVNTKDNLGRSALLVVAERGMTAVVRLLLKEGADVNTKDNNGRTALYTAARRGSTAVVQLVLKEGADVNMKYKIGRTALMAAVDEREAAVVQLLLKKGANISTKDKNGSTVLHAVVCKDWYRTGRYTRRRDYVTVVQILLEAGVELDARDDLGRTALHIAAKLGCIGGVRSLLHAGAEYDARDSGLGRTALSIAAGRGNTIVVELLLNAGAELDARDDLGRTALHSAAERGHTVAVHLLLHAGAEIDARDDFGRTALHVAPKWDPTSAVQLLLSAGADYELKAHDGKDARVIRTPLEIAVSRKCWDVAKLLLKAKKRQETEEESLGTNWHWTKTGDLILPIQTEGAPDI